MKEHSISCLAEPTRRGFVAKLHVGLQFFFLCWIAIVSSGCAGLGFAAPVTHAEVVEQWLAGGTHEQVEAREALQVQRQPVMLRPPMAVAAITERTTLVAAYPPSSSQVEDRLAAPEEEAQSELPRLSRTINVLVLGSDRRPRMPNWRTDVIMIVVMDLDTGQAGVISIPRDVYIADVPNHRPNRINVVDYLGEQDEPKGGGPKLLAGIIEREMGIPIHHYLRFDFEGFKKVVDALGGLEITVDCPVYDYLPEEDISLALRPGLHRLDGKQALGYVRSRRQGGDLERSRRQQRVIWAVRDQLRRENLISRVPALYAALHNSVQTDINLMAAIRFVRFALALEEENVHGLVLTSPDLIQSGWRGGMSVFVADWPKIATEVQAIFDRPAFVESNTVGEDGDRQRCP